MSVSHVWVLGRGPRGKGETVVGRSWVGPRQFVGAGAGRGGYSHFTASSASSLLALRISVFACSLIFAICAPRFGFSGSGGGGMLVPRGESVMLRRRRWSVFSSVSSVAICVDGREGQLMDLLVGSRCRGRRVKVSASMFCVIWGRDG